jgi:hypothetical protein
MPSELSPREAYPHAATRVTGAAVPHRICQSVRDIRTAYTAARAFVFGRETVDSASGPASPVLTGYGRRAGGLGPGLTSDSADAARAVLRDDLSAGSQVFRHPPALPV